MVPSKGYRYLAADTGEWNPNRVSKSGYQVEIGSTVNEVEEYIYRRIQKFVELYGKPDGEIFLSTERKLDFGVAIQGIIEIMRKTNWDQEAIGDTLWNHTTTTK